VTNVVILNSKAHRDLTVEAGPSARLGDAQHFVPVIVSEFPLLVVQCPILLSKDAETGAFYCGAMLGFDEGENLFLRPDGGFDGHRPLNLQRGPFFTAGSDLAIDLESPRVGASDGQRLFTEEGGPTPYLESVMGLFQQLHPGLERSKVFVDTLLKLKLVEPVSIDVAFDDGQRRELVGLYTIDQDALRALPDEAALDLFRRGYLQLIYLMIASLKQIPRMAEAKNRRLLPTDARPARFG
jgi:hypothetical protein